MFYKYFELRDNTKFQKAFEKLAQFLRSGLSPCCATKHVPYSILSQNVKFQLKSVIYYQLCQKMEENPHDSPLF